jgi:hypothetical protein
MNLLMCFTALFIFAFIMIKPTTTTDKESALQPRGKLIIHLHWPDASYTDLDLWVRTENPMAIISYRSKDAANMWLDHDSLGAGSNSVTMTNGTIKQTFGNDEIVQIKECTNTRVTVNVHDYHPSNDSKDFPMTATVEIVTPPSYDKFLTKTITLDGTRGQELTAFSFSLDEDCKITDIDQNTFIPFIYMNTTRVPEPGQPIPGSEQYQNMPHPQGVP